jgi:hypothetical protein
MFSLPVIPMFVLQLVPVPEKSLRVPGKESDTYLAEVRKSEIWLSLKVTTQKYSLHLFFFLISDGRRHADWQRRW